MWDLTSKGAYIEACEYVDKLAKAAIIAALERDLMKIFNDKIKELETLIEHSYESGVSLEEAERLAGRFLHAQLQVSEELRKADLDSRMRKSGLKAVKAAVYSDACSKADKKPTEGALEHTINSNELVNGEQTELDKAEVSRDELTRIYNVFQAAHVHFRQMSKGVFSG